MTIPIATVTFDLAGTRCAANLGPDGRWSCPGVPALAAGLNLMFPIDGGTSRGMPGSAEAHAAAAYLRGTAEVHAGPGDPSLDY